MSSDILVKLIWESFHEHNSVAFLYYIIYTHFFGRPFENPRGVHASSYCGW